MSPSLTLYNQFQTSLQHWTDLIHNKRDEEDSITIPHHGNMDPLPDTHLTSLLQFRFGYTEFLMSTISEMWNLRPNFVLRPPDQKASPPSRKCQIEGAPHHYVPLRCAADGDSIRRRHRGLTENMKIIDYCTWRKIHDHKVLPGRWRNLSFRRICSLGSDTRCTFIICHGFSALFSRFILLLEEDFCICKILASSKISIIHQFMNA